MGRKKILAASQAQESFELKPFCYYCEREFDSTKTLIQHQRTKHFNCAECGLKFDTVTGLRVHMLNAYKKTMKEVPNSIPGRENPDIVVHGMEGLPKGVVEEKTRKAMAEREKAKEEDARRAAPAARQERDRSSQVSSAASAPAERSSEAPSPPAASKPSPPPPEASPQPPQPAAPAPVRAVASPSPPRASPAPTPTTAAAPAVAGQERREAQAEVPAASQLPQAMMPGLSPAVVKLLSGDSSSAPTASGGMMTLNSVPGYLVPAALSRLHPVALQVLAAAGALAPEKAPASLPAPVRQVPFPGAMVAPTPGTLLPSMPPGALQNPGPAPTPLTGAGLPHPGAAGPWAMGGPPGLGNTIGMAGAAGAMGIVGSLAPPIPALGEPDEKRLRLAPPV